MALGVRATDHQQGNASTFTLTQPVAFVAGDRLMAVVTHASGLHFNALPAGWQELGAAFGSTTLRVWSFTGGASASTSPWTFGFSDSAAHAYAAAIIDLSPNSTFQPSTEAILLQVQTPATTGAANTPAVTPPTANDLILHLATWGRGTSWTPPGTVTEQVDIRSGSTSSDVSLFVGSEALATGAGVASTTRAIANDNPFGATSDSPSVGQVALRSAAPPGAWTGDFETGDTSQYRAFNAADSSRIQILSDTPHYGTKYARFTADDADVFPLTPTADPRCQLNGPRYMFEGDTRWISCAIRLPSDFPDVPHYPDGWLVLFQVFGPPYNGNPNLALKADLDFFRLEAYGVTTLWRAPLVRSAWQDFSLRVFFSQNASLGWVEVHYNGEPQQMLSGKRRYYFQTITSDQTDGMEAIPTVYRKHGMVTGAVSADFDGVRVDTNAPSTLTKATLAPSVRLGFGRRALRA